MRNLQVNFKNIDSELPISIALSGKLTSASAMDFKKDILKLIEKNVNDCHVDISDLEQMDVTGVNALAMAHKAAERSGRKLILVSTDANPAEEFLCLSKFNRYFNFKRA